MPESTFVGRQNYIDQFRELTDKSPSEPEYILYLLGKGGIGKTKILQEIIKICDKNEIPHSGIIDFYGFEMSSRTTAVAHKIAKALRAYDKSGIFYKYWKLRKEFEIGKISEQDVVSEFLPSLCQWIDTVVAAGKRPVLMFDTVEIIKYSIVEKDLVNDWLPQFKKAVVILSGREKEQEKLDFPEEIAPFVVQSQIDTFTREEAIEYLQERNVWDAIEEDKVSDKIFEFTQKKPLLLALSADRIYGSSCSSSISPKELVKDADTLSFEKTLVEELERVDVIRNPEGTILPYMAHIIRHFDKELIEFLQPDISDQAETILKNLSELSFVKERIEENGFRTYWLQDELRALFHKHVFSAYPEKWDRECRVLSEKMIAFHDKKLGEAKEKGDILEEQRCIARRFYHEIYLDPKAYSKLREKFQKARESYQYGFASLLIGTVRFLADSLSESQYYTFKLAEGRWLTDLGDTKRAEEQLQKLFKDNYSNQLRLPFIYDALGGVAFVLGRFEDALEYYKKTLELIQNPVLIKISGKLFHIYENIIGETYKHMGRWEDAIVYFKKAYNSALQNEKDLNRIATIIYNLGHTYGLSGEYKAGIDYCEQAIDILEKTSSIPKLAKVKILQGDIYRRAGDYDRAIEDIQKAIKNFEGLDHRNLADSYYYLGFAQWYKAIEERNNGLLIEAQRTFEKCIEMSENYKLNMELPKALHEVSQIYWELGDKEKARSVNNEAYDLAIKAHDIYYSINSLVKKAEFDYEDSKYENIPEYAEVLKREFEDKRYEFPLFYGRMRRIRGAIAYHQEKYDDSSDYYAEGLYLIVQHGGYGKYTIDNELRELEANLSRLSTESSLKFYLTLKEVWEKKDKKNLKLTTWIDRHICSLFLKIKQSGA